MKPSFKSKLHSHFTDLSDDSSIDEDNVPVEHLEKCKATIEECSRILQDPSLIDNPNRIVNSVRLLFTKRKTLEAKIASSKKDIQSIVAISEKDLTLTNLNAMIEQRKAEIVKLDASISKIQAERKKIEQEMSEFQQKQNQFFEMQDIQSQIAVLTEQLENSARKTEEYQATYAKLLEEKHNRKSVNASQELAEERLRRMNIQNAIDSLRSEEEKQVGARRIFIQEKKEKLRKELNEIETENSSLRDLYRQSQHYSDEITRYNVLISREQREPEKMETLSTEPHHMNKDRVSRLILLLLTDGCSENILSSLAEELSWNEQQTNDFKQLIEGNKTKGIGAMWSEWLEEVADADD